MSAARGAIDSVLLIGFGGPTAPHEILPFLRNVVAGRGIPDERLRAVEHHYLEVGGRSPYNELTERLRAALEAWLAARGEALPVHVGMRNWHPYLEETLRGMRDLGLRHALGAILAAHRSEASWERYQADVARAQLALGGEGPAVTYLGPWFSDAGFLEASVQRIEQAAGHRRGTWPAEVPILFTAHSIPVAMASVSPYENDLRASCEGVAGILGASEWELAYQSRSGDPRTPWLEPDVNDALRRRAARGTKEVVVLAIGFLSDHVEVLYDLDIEARKTCDELGLVLHRAGCVNDHPVFVEALGKRVLEARALVSPVPSSQ
jgi:ferrochelatase